MSSLRGKVALITGASSGIGAGTSVLFAKLGALLALNGRDVDNLHKVARQCAEAGAAQVHRDVTWRSRRTEGSRRSEAPWLAACGDIASPKLGQFLITQTATGSDLSGRGLTRPFLLFCPCFLDKIVGPIQTNYSID